MELLQEALVCGRVSVSRAHRKERQHGARQVRLDGGRVEDDLSVAAKDGNDRMVHSHTLSTDSAERQQLMGVWFGCRRGSR